MSLCSLFNTAIQVYVVPLSAVNGVWPFDYNGDGGGGGDGDGSDDCGCDCNDVMMFFKCQTFSKP